MFAHGAVNAFVLHRRRAGDDAQVAVLGERGDELVGQAIGIVILGRIARKIRQGQHGDRVNSANTVFAKTFLAKTRSRSPATFSAKVEAITTSKATAAQGHFRMPGFHRS